SILQAIRDKYVGNYDKVAYVIINNDFNYDANILCNELLNKISNIETVVIDEVTNIKDLANTGDAIFNKIRGLNKAVILSGTNTLALEFTRQNSLFHRVISKNITHITFGEYKRLFNLKLEDYIKTGGTLRTQIKDENGLKHYIDTAIVENIVNTIDKNKNKVTYNATWAINLSKNEIRAILYNCIYSIIFKDILIDRPGIKKEIEQKFRISIDNYEFDTGLYSPDIIRNYICDELNIKNKELISAVDIKNVISMLEELGILISIENKGNDGNKQYYFTNQSIVIQVYKIVYNIIGNIIGFNKSKIDNTNGITSNILGKSFESVIAVSSYYYALYNNLDIAFFRNKQGREIDLIIYKNLSDTFETVSVYYEIKLTNDADIAVIKTHWLNDKNYRQGEYYNELDNGEVLKRYLVYTGENKVFTKFSRELQVKSGLTQSQIELKNSGIELINAEDYLLNPNKYLQALKNYK
ncbi:MAG: hypothetical protein IJ593_02065, partial [Lachnospiraceae bacterium]|nr:hypothetical protein [Lachnospiraceae bacterium]